MQKKKNSEKLLSRCPFFFRLEALFSNHSSIKPPVRYDSRFSNEDTARTVEGLLIVIGEDSGGPRENRQMGEESSWVSCEKEEESERKERRGTNWNGAN